MLATALPTMFNSAIPRQLSQLLRLPFLGIRVTILVFDGHRHRRKQTSQPTLHVSNTFPNLLATKLLPLCLLSLGFKPVILGLSDALPGISMCPLKLHMVFSVFCRKPLGVHFVSVLNRRFNGISTLPEPVRVTSFLNSHEAVAGSISATILSSPADFPFQSLPTFYFISSLVTTGSSTCEWSTMPDNTSSAAVLCTFSTLSKCLFQCGSFSSAF